MRRPMYDDELLGKAFDPKLARKSFQFIVPYKKKIGLAMLAMVLTAGTGLVGPHLTQIAIDSGMKKGDVRVLKIVALVYIFTFVLRWIFQYWQTIAISILGQRVVYDIRHKLFSHIQNLSLDFFDNREIGRIIARLTSDVGSVNALVTSGSLSLVTDSLKLIGIIIILVNKSLELSLLVFTLMVPLWIVTAVFRKKNRLAYRDVRRKVATVTAHVAENVSGVKVVKSFSREAENLNRFKKVNRETRDAQMHASMLGAIFWPTMEVISWIGIGMIYWYGGLGVIRGELTLGLLLAFVGYMHQFFEPIRNMSGLYQTMQDAMAGAERIFEILDQEPTVKDKPGAIELPPIRGDVEFKNVCFAYD
ncbi:MAG: ABC transporter ATP-binding protein, partial [Armatimonadetes bacterium]|nr:ABC transporter ATP-binding protein [Armatimonadota bacterium]